MKKNRYKPETEFEKEIFSDLIGKIRSVKDKELSEDFDNHFHSALGKVNPIKPLGMKLRESAGKHKFKLYISFASAAVSIIILFMIISRNGTSSKYNLPDKFPVKKTFISSDSVKRNNDKTHLEQMEGIKKPKSLITGTGRTGSDNSDKALNPKLYKPDSLNSILKSDDSLTSGKQQKKSH